MIGNKEYKIKLNKAKKTYTIRVYEKKRLVAKYRGYPQGNEYSEHWTEADIYNFLKNSNDYYRV